MIYLLDTNTVSYLFDAEAALGSNVRARYTGLGEDDYCAVSVMAIYELATLAEAKPDLAGLQARARDELDVLNLSPRYARAFARMKVAWARRTGAKVRHLAKHNFDLLLAALAIELDATLVSNDQMFAGLREIEPSLKLEDWTT